MRFALPTGEFAALVCGRGAPLVWLHGFPDHPPTAAPLFAELAGRGFHVCAPWLRGYAPSPLAGPFALGALVADVLALIDRVSPTAPVALVGHDWGAAIAYAACIAAPDRIARAVTLALPHPLSFLRQLRAPAQLRRSWYMALFQLPGAGAIVAARRLALVDRLWRAWSPGFVLDAARRAELHRCLAASLPAPLGYYRAVGRAGTTRDLRALATPIRVPLLQLHGADDGCVLPPAGDDRQRFAAAHAIDVVPGVGHFLHLERPAAIASQIAGWLAADLA